MICRKVTTEKPTAKAMSARARGESTPPQSRSGPEQGGENRLGEPAQAQAGHGDAQLGGAEIGGEILQNVPGQAGAAVALHDQGVQLGVAQFDEGEFSGDEKAVDQHDGQDAQNPQPLRKLKAWPSIYKFTSPKMTRRMSCRLINPVSPWSALKTTPRRQPVACMRRRASSRRSSSGRKKAGSM